MNLEEYNQFCGSLKATSHVVQWGDSTVWKVGGKVFAISSDADRSDSDQDLGDKRAGDEIMVTFKTTPEEYEYLIQMPGVRPAPYLASRGFTWAQHFEQPGLDDDELMEQIEESHSIVGAGLSKKKQRELGLLSD